MGAARTGLGVKAGLRKMGGQDSHLFTCNVSGLDMSTGMTRFPTSEPLRTASTSRSYSVLGVRYRLQLAPVVPPPPQRGATPLFFFLQKQSDD